MSTVALALHQHPHCVAYLVLNGRLCHARMAFNSGKGLPPDYCEFVAQWAIYGGDEFTFEICGRWYGSWTMQESITGPSAANLCCCATASLCSWGFSDSPLLLSREGAFFIVLYLIFSLVSYFSVICTSEMFWKYCIIPYAISSWLTRCVACRVSCRAVNCLYDVYYVYWWRSWWCSLPLTLSGLGASSPGSGAWIPLT